MARWEPIKRAGKLQVKGKRGPERMDIEVPLSSTPPPEWTDYFHRTEARRRSDENEDYPLPQVIENAICIAPRDGELASWRGRIDKAIQDANTFYQSQVIPRAQAERKAAENAEEEDQRRIERAQREADEE